MAENNQQSAPRTPQERTKPTALEIVKDVVTILQGVATIAGIGAAAWWFFFQGENRAKVNVDMSAYHRRLDSKTTLVAVQVKAHNVGKRPTNINKGAFRIDRVSPLDIDVGNLKRALQADGKDLGVFTWSTLDKREVPYAMVLAPGEYDTFYQEFLVPSHLQAVRVYASLSDPSRENQLWAAVMFHDLAPTGTSQPDAKGTPAKASPRSPPMRQ